MMETGVNLTEAPAARNLPAAAAPTDP